VVYVLIMDVEISHADVYKFYCWLDVAGFLPKDFRDVMDFITRLFNAMKFNYMEATRRFLHDFGYFAWELSRDKVHLATMPLNMYYINADWRSMGVEPVDLFVDIGSPFKHIYYVIREAVQNAYSIVGLSRTEHVEVYAKFFADERGFCRNVWHPCDPQAVAEKVKDDAVHVDINPYLNEYKRELLAEALKLARELREAGT